MRLLQGPYFAHLATKQSQMLKLGKLWRQRSMVLTNFDGAGVGFGFGVGCGFGVGWGFGGTPLNIFGLGAGGGCGVGLGLGWGFGMAYGSRYHTSAVTFQGIEFESKSTEEKDPKKFFRKQLEVR